MGKNPFQPYAVARHRMEAYKKNIFMKCVRTYIDHADTLFLTDDKEAINEAEQYYVIAAHLLGPKPPKIPPLPNPSPSVTPPCGRNWTTSRGGWS